VTGPPTTTQANVALIAASPTRPPTVVWWLVTLIRTARMGIVASQTATTAASQTTPSGTSNCRFTHFPR
jgi:hypothetical protein